MLSDLPPAIERVWVRIDGAGCQKKLVRFFNDPASRPEALRRFGVIGFVVSEDLNEKMKESLARTPEGWWGPLSGSELQCADLDHVSDWNAGPVSIGLKIPSLRVEVVRFAHERCGRGEEVHAVLKDDLAGGIWRC